MNLKKLTGKLTTIVAAGAMVMSIGGGVVWANNCKDDYVRMSFDEAAGEYLNYTEGRNKEDTSCGYIKGKSASNGYSFNATLVGLMVIILIIIMMYFRGMRYGCTIM